MCNLCDTWTQVNVDKAYLMWCEKYLEDKIKLRYYKEVINPTLEDQKYLSVLTSSKKKLI